jgi:hypothetical protein
MLALPKFRPGLRAVDQHQVDVVQAERPQRSVDAVLGFGVALALGGELGGHEELVAGNAAGAQPSPTPRSLA